MAPPERGAPLCENTLREASEVMSVLSHRVSLGVVPAVVLEVLVGPSRGVRESLQNGKALGDRTGLSVTPRALVGCKWNRAVWCR